MREVTVTGSVRADVGDVFDFLVDNRNDELWCPMVSEVELVEGQPGPGALYRYRQGQGPGRPPAEAWMRTTVAERPRRLEWDDGGRSFPYRSVVELAERDGRTHLRHTNRVTLPSRAQQAVWWTLANVVLRLQLRNLRRELER